MTNIRLNQIQNDKSHHPSINYMLGIVNKTLSIDICSNNHNPEANTHTDKPKTAHNKPNYTSLSKPIPNKKAESYGQKIKSFVKSLFPTYKRLNPDFIKFELNKWIDKEYRPTHFISIQLPEHIKSANFNTSIRHLKNMMKAFEKSLMNNWERHHLRFIAFAENGSSTDWHFHILFNHGKYTDEKLQNAVLKAIIREQLPFYCLDLKRIDENKQTVERYCTKEIKIYWDSKFDSDRIIFSECLFGL